MTPYKSITYTGSQIYVMTDTATGETNVALRGPLSIVRSVGRRVPYAGWWYHITKEGFENWLLLP